MNELNPNIKRTFQYEAPGIKIHVQFPVHRATFFANHVKFGEGQVVFRSIFAECMVGDSHVKVVFMQRGYEWPILIFINGSLVSGNWAFQHVESQRNVSLQKEGLKSIPLLN